LGQNLWHDCVESSRNTKHLKKREYRNWTQHVTMEEERFYRGADKSLARPGRKQAKRQKILMFIYPIYYQNWRNISTIYIYNKTNIKRNILTFKQNTSGSRSD